MAEVSKNGIELMIRKNCDEKSDKIFTKIEEIAETVCRELGAFGAKIDHVIGKAEEHEKRLDDLEDNPGKEAQSELARLRKYRDKVRIVLMTAAISIPLTVVIGVVTYFLTTAFGG